MERLGFTLALALAIAATGCGHGSGSGGVFSASSATAAAASSGSRAAPTSSSSSGPSVALPHAVPTPAPPAASRYWPLQAPTPSLPTYVTSRAWLTDASLYATYVDHTVRTPGLSELGVYGIGNGRCFSLVASSYPLNTLHELSGPTYQNVGGYFGDMKTTHAVSGIAPTIAREWVLKPRRAAVVLAKLETAQGELTTIDFAPPDRSSIVRIVVVKNTTSAPLASVEVVTRLEGACRAERDRLVQDRGSKKLSIGSTKGGVMGGGARPVGQELHVDLGTLAPGAEARAALTLVTTFGGNGEAQEIAALDAAGADKLLDDTRAWWAAWFQQGAQLKLPDPKVNDLIEDMLVTCRVQQAEHGGLAPMSRYTSCYLRDTEGPTRLFLATARADDVRRMVDYTYKASVIDACIANSFAIDLDPKNAGAPPAWANVGFMPGYNSVEAPCYAPFIMDAYYRASGDLALAREQFDFCYWALVRQEIAPSGLMKWSGDEPFRFVLTNACGLFNHEKNAYSPATSFLFAACAEKLAAIAHTLGRAQEEATLRAKAKLVRDGCEQNAWLGTFYSPDLFFWGALAVRQPFEDINLLPLHAGYLDPLDPKAESNLLETRARLGSGRAAGRIQSPSVISGVLESYDGMVPGYYLENLALVDHPDAELAFNAIDDVSLPSGETAEGMWFQGDRALILQYSTDGTSNGDTCARYRPWEGGINVWSLLVYLIGLKQDATGARPAVTIAPHMPNGWSSFEARGLASGAARFDLVARDAPGERTYEITNRGSVPLDATVVISLAATSVREVLVDGKPLPIASLATTSRFGRLRVTVPAIALAPGFGSRVVARY